MVPILLLISVLGALLGTSAAITLAWKSNILDRPSSVKIHTNPVPRIGGLGILLGSSAALFIWMIISPQTAQPAMALLPGAIGMSLVGIVDDLKNLNPKTKFAGQLLVAAATAILLHEYLEITPRWSVISAILILCTCNAVNLLDGLDGLAAGVALIASIIFGILSAIRGFTEGVLFALIVMGACAGFLPYNWHRAKTFMGDSGSLLLGYLLAAQAILQIRQCETNIQWLLTVALVLMVPAFDTFVAILRRAVNHKPLFSPDKNHIYNRIMDYEIKHEKAVLTMYGLTLTAGIAAVLSEIAPPVGKAGVTVIVMAGVMLMVKRLELLREQPL